MESGPIQRPRPLWQAAVALSLWTALFALGWLLLAGPDPAAWIIGVPTVAGAVWAKARLSDRRVGGLSPLGVVRFLPYFLWESLKGGIDVALRVVGPRVRVDPGYLEYRMHLLRPSARVAFMDAVNLLPGTLTADVAGDRLSIHTLDRGAEPLQSLNELEKRIGDLFGERLPTHRTPEP